AVATAVDEVRSLLAANRKAGSGKKGERAAAQLGVFAAGRIDTERFESLFSEQEALDADAAERIEEALATLTELLEAGDGLYSVKVRPGGDLRDAVRDGLARAGRAFGAGRAVERARAGAPAEDYRNGFGPDRWNRAERTVAPPLVVELDGADFRPAGLADYLEGGQAIVLLVKKPAPPAALARLVAPGTLVVQDTGPDAFDVLATWEGPAVVAVVPEGAAVFHYAPDEDGPGRLTVESAPEDPRAVGVLSAARQRTDLRLLRMLEGAGAGPVVTAATAADSTPADPTDKLAAWLLRQATIPEPGEV
ncbi:MAG: hypothetical protein P8177_01135, partial [Gemmatimonadota bacterium]